MLIAPLIYKWRDWLHKKCINIQWQHIALLIKINTFPLGNRNHLRAVFDSCGWQLCRKGLNKQTNEQTKPPNQPKQHNFLEWGWKSGKKSRSGTQKLFTGSSLLNRARWGDSLLHPTNSTSPILIFFFLLPLFLISALPIPEVTIFHLFIHSFFQYTLFQARGWTRVCRVKCWYSGPIVPIPIKTLIFFKKSSLR